MATDTDAGEQEVAPSRPRRRRRLVTALVAVFVALAGLVALDWRLANDVLLVSVDFPGPAPGLAVLSAAQEALIAELGPPDGFTIFFYESEQGAPTRSETWSYYAAGREMSFVDGEMTTDERPDESPDDVIAAPYRPEAFSAFMSLDEVVSTSSIDEYVTVDLENELVPGGAVYVAEQLMFGTRDGVLLYVEAVPLAPDEAAGS